MLKVMQINLNRATAAHDLAMHNANTKKIDIVLATEPNDRIVKTQSKWTKSKPTNLIDAAIRTLGNLKISSTGSERYITHITTNDITIISCYAKPRGPTAEYESVLNSLDRLLSRNKHCILTGDFNAKSTEWGGDHTDTRGEMLTELLQKHNMVLLNNGRTPTFSNKNGSSYIDLTACTDTIHNRIINWKVDSDEESYSPHRYVFFDIVPSQPETTRRKTPWKWKVDSFNNEVAKEFVKDHIAITNHTALSSMLLNICQDTMQKSNPSNKRRAIYWWNDEIKELHKKTNEHRRKLTRSKTRGATAEVVEQLRRLYKTSRKALYSAISKNKKKKWQELIKAIDEDPWGEAYKIVVKRTNIGTNITPEANSMEGIVKKLFPSHDIKEWERPNTGSTDIGFTEDEIKTAGRQLKRRKAPGPDTIPPEIIKWMTVHKPQLLLDVMNDCLRKGYFPEQWKIARLVLIPKPGKTDYQEASSYRPLCLLNAISKLLELLIANRLENHLHSRNVISTNQFGFRKGLSTTDAIQKVVDIADAEKGKGKARAHCALTTLDVRNAFNSIPWEHIVKSLEAVDTPEYVLNIICSYLTDRWIEINGKRYQITRGVPQGSILGPKLWVISYNSLLSMPVPRGITLIGFADDLGIVSTDKSIVRLSNITNQTIELVMEWMTERKMEIAAEKTEAVILSGRKELETPMTFEIGEAIITPKHYLKYLGVYIDKNLTFGKHIEMTAKKAETTISALRKLLPRVEGPNESKRRLLGRVAESVMLYAAPVWQRGLKYDKYRGSLLRAQRKLTLAISRAYRTAPTTVLSVIANTPPIDLQALERAKGWKKSKQEKEELKKRTLADWQSRWASMPDTRLKTLLPDITPWVTRGHGEVSYWTTQMLTGHGCFQSYLHKIGRAISDDCMFCGETDDPEHTLALCPRWATVRLQTTLVAGTVLCGNNLVTYMLQNKRSWDTATHMIDTIMRGKEKEERRRERAE